jgi:transposase
MSPVVSELYQFVIGVDTHAATHTLAVLTAANGLVLATDTFPATAPGVARALTWIDRRTGDGKVLVVVEGTGSYGAILTERLELADRRGVGKSDVLDATRIARAVLGLKVDELRTPRTLSAGDDVSSGSRVALRVLVVARDQMTGNGPAPSTP